MVSRVLGLGPVGQLGEKYSLWVAVSVAVAWVQIGEFSFILATSGKNLGIFDDRLKPPQATPFQRQW
jgi:hypothetical protein